MLADVPHDGATRRVTPDACQGALGTWWSLGVPGLGAGRKRTIKKGSSQSLVGNSFRKDI